MMASPELHSILPSGDRWDADLAGIALRFGAGRLDELGTAARALGGTTVLLVVDGGLRAARHIDRAEAALAAAGVDFLTFDGVAPNPGSDLVERAAALAEPRTVDLIVGMGGGSAMDCAKGVNFLLTNGGRMADYWGYGKTTQPMLPTIGVPTTAGTGSDAQSYAVIAQADTGRKMACGAAGAAFRKVILDPALLLSTPIDTVATAGIDALSHAVESHVTQNRSARSSALSLAAWRLVEGNFEACFDGEADQIECRGKMMLGAHLAGAAIEVSMLGAAHASANPLTARYGITHGTAVGLMLPQVVRFNAEASEIHYRELWSEGAEALAERIEELRAIARLPGTIREFGVSESSLAELAGLATHEWTGEHNPRPVEERDFLRLYEAAY